MMQHQISNEVVEEIRKKNDIIEVVSDYVQLTKKGRNFFGVCPFHNDTNPSMSVSSDKQIYRCFSCGAGGNVFTFIMDYENITFREALKLLGDRVGINVDLGNTKATKSTINENERTSLNIHELTSRYYEYVLNNTEIGLSAIEYLKNRGINEEIIKEFRIGLAPSSYNSLTNFIKSKGFIEKDILNSNLILKNDNGYYDRFRNRIMFPLNDINGMIVGFSGRIYTPSEEPKYLNSPESEIFKKGEMLYNYHKAKPTIRKKQRCILMEGFMDVIRASSVGVTECVASMGTALTLQQAKLIKKTSPNVIICYDGDDAGQLASLKACNELESIGCKVKVVSIKDKLDPDEFIKKYGKDAFNQLLDNALSSIDFKIIYFKRNLNFKNSDDLTTYLHNILNVIKNVNNELETSIYLRKISDETNVAMDKLEQELNRLKNNEAPKVQRTPKLTIPIPKDKYFIAQQMLVAYMLKSKEVVNIYKRDLNYLPTLEYRTLASQLIIFYEKGNEPNIAKFITDLRDDEILVKLVAELETLELIKDDYSIEEINDNIRVINEYKINLEIEMLQKLMDDSVTNEEKLKYSERIIQLINQR